MYHNYFGLREQAFSIAVNPRYLYMSQQHKEALAHLLYGVKGGGFVLLSGEVGTGKTTIIRCLLEQLPENTEIAIVLNPMANVPEMLSTICDELGIEYDRDDLGIKKLTDALHEYLLENHGRGYNTVLLIDEAQLLSAEALEQIRLLTNLETTTQKLLQIVLVGQPEINDLLAQPRLRQLSQRITARYHLTPLSLDETEAYIKHRLKVAGMPEERNPFTPRVVRRIHAFTGGIPRRINILCERTLVGAYGHNKQQVDSQILKLARDEVAGRAEGFKPDPTSNWWKKAVAGSAAVVVLTIAASAYFILDPQLGSPAPQPGLPETRAAMPETGSSIQNASLVEPAPPAPENNFLFNNQITAQETLFKYLTVPVSPDKYPCWQQQVQCERLEFATWQDIKALNRPVVLSLTTPEKFKAYAVLVGFEQDNALLLNTDGELETLALTELGPMWSGSVFYTWRVPAGFEEPIMLGQRNPTVSWVARQFAVLDQQASPLTDNRYNRALQERVKIFQEANGLDTDGIIGKQTILKLNEVIGVDKTLIAELLDNNN